MKKILALAMAIVMMMAIAVPAFAATLDVATSSGDAEVITDISGVSGDGTYTVTYPATMALAWGDETTAFQYSVTSQLKTGKCVSVKIVDKDANGLVMVNADGATLAYSLGGTTSTTTSAPVVTDEAFDYSVDVLKADWDAASFDEYKDTLTFSSEVVDL